MLHPYCGEELDAIGDFNQRNTIVFEDGENVAFTPDGRETVEDDLLVRDKTHGRLFNLNLSRN
jgi:hypothetical protein